MHVIVNVSVSTFIMYSVQWVWLECSLPLVVELVCGAACTFYSLGRLQWAQLQCQLASESHGGEGSLSKNTMADIYCHYNDTHKLNIFWYNRNIL